MTVHNLGYPRIGRKREMKFAIERYWKGAIDAETLRATARRVRNERWKTQAEAGIELIPVGDFPLYDQVLQMSLTLGVFPRRFRESGAVERLSRLDLEFAIARGIAASPKEGGAAVNEDIPPSAMTKWFDTNYHYITPELDGAESDSEGGTGNPFSPDPSALVEEARDARAAGYRPKAVLVGPVTYLWLAGASPDLAAHAGEAYRRIADALAPHVEWIQYDEPILALDLPVLWQDAFRVAYAALNPATPATITGAAGTETGAHRRRAPRPAEPQQRAPVLIATYFGPLEENLSLLLELPVEGYHLDAVRGPADIMPAAKALREGQILSVGVVNGRNVWKTDRAAALESLIPLYRDLRDRLWIAPSCSLLHVPLNVEDEEELDPEVRSRLAFADQKLHELAALRRDLHAGAAGDETGARRPGQGHTASHTGARRPAAAHTAAHATGHEAAGLARGTDTSASRPGAVLPPPEELKALAERKSSYAERATLQRRRFGLPAFPTTTIGSFPQTAEIRAARRAARRGELSPERYEERIREEIAGTIKKQEEIGLDVLVHGEAERTDMVEYFGRQLEGFAFTAHGWVQSYGTRCVKPPIIYGDVDRPRPMTVKWITYAQSLTDRPVKGMLTGPVTILQWSFVREDQPRRDTALQIALALRREVRDLESAGIGIIQMDEPALREGLPLRRSRRQEYLDWAVLAFRLATSVVTNQTQIHTHMCYSRFNEIIEAIAALDADVITIEAARSRMRLLDAFHRYSYPNEIGPGIYDIHSPLVPTANQIATLLERALEHIPRERLWINPDCGLKTRSWAEVEPSLRNMVDAARLMRAS